MTAFERSQAKYVKKSYKTTNRSEYEAALRQRANRTVRSLVDNSVCRYEALIGRTMRSRTLQGQRVKAR